MKKFTLNELLELEERIKSKPSEDNVRVVWQEYLRLADQDAPRLIVELKWHRSLIYHLVNHAEGDLKRIMRTWKYESIDKLS